MSKTILTFLGKDSGFGDKNNSAYIEEDEKFILIDCGFTVFEILKNKFNFNKYKNIEIIITHLHNDHAGSLCQLILYIWFTYHKKVIVISKCQKIKEYLEITGAPNEAYEIKECTENIKFIETEHVKELDSYGFEMNIRGKRIIYTGDTKTLEPFLNYLKEANELYVDVSKNGGVHLQINEVLPILKKIKEQRNQNHINAYR